MRLIAKYTPLGPVAEGDTEMLWGALCSVANIGTEDAPKMVYVTEAEKEDAEAMIESGRFQAAEQPAKVGKAGKSDD